MTGRCGGSGLPWKARSLPIGRGGKATFPSGAARHLCVGPEVDFFPRGGFLSRFFPFGAVRTPNSFSEKFFYLRGRNHAATDDPLRREDLLA